MNTKKRRRIKQGFFLQTTEGQKEKHIECDMLSTFLIPHHYCVHEKRLHFPPHPSTSR